MSHSISDSPNLSPAVVDQHDHDQRWYAVYTCARHEKKIAEYLAGTSIEQFLPLYETVRRWKDRRVRLHLPLFPGYIFVRVSLPEQQLKVLQTRGVVRLVSFNGKPVPLPDFEMSALRRGLASGVHAEPYPHLAVGRSVRVKAGPLCGLAGKLVRKKENFRIVIAVDAISRSIICEVSLEDIEPLPPSSPRGSATRNQIHLPAPAPAGGILV